MFILEGGWIIVRDGWELVFGIVLAHMLCPREIEGLGRPDLAKIGTD
jgi:hypothetical protein